MPSAPTDDRFICNYDSAIDAIVVRILEEPSVNTICEWRVRLVGEIRKFACVGLLVHIDGFDQWRRDTVLALKHLLLSDAVIRLHVDRFAFVRWHEDSDPHFSTACEGYFSSFRTAWLWLKWNRGAASCEVGRAV